MPQRRNGDGCEDEEVVVQEPDDGYEDRAYGHARADVDGKPPGIEDPADERLHERRREVVDRDDQPGEEERVALLCDEERQDCRKNG
ncbi:hypothetical protein DSECCO2_624870 [anaerobic digester metagenome]